MGHKGYSVDSVPKTAQVELRSGRVDAPAAHMPELVLADEPVKRDGAHEIDVFR